MQGVGIQTFSLFPRSVTPLDGANVQHNPSDPPSRGSSKSSRKRNYPSSSQVYESGRTQKGDEGGRIRVAKAITAVAEYIGTASPERFDDSAFQHGDASDFPEIPGEEQRNSGLQRIRRSYNQPREDDPDDTRMPDRSRSRAVSFNGSTASRLTTAERLTRSRTTSPQRPQASPPGIGSNRSAPWHPTTDPTGARLQHRSDTLGIPTVSNTPAPYTMPSQAAESSTIATIENGSPIILVSNAKDS